jgi:signal transduction histidine kinase
VSAASSNATLLEMLRAKAMLLLRREKELFELRHEQTRIEAWLNVFHKISIDLRGKTAGALLETWVAAMTETLNFQVAAVYRGDPHGTTLQLIAEAANAPLPGSVAIDAAIGDFLTQNQGGSSRDLPAHVRAALGSAVGLGRFLWASFATRETPLYVLLAGFSPQAGRFHSVSEHDPDHYKLFAAHLAALLDNVSLIGALNSERSELQQSNRQLDASLNELREMQGRLVQSSKVLAEVSRRAGMAEVATGVLHNVGNALNGVNISAEVTAARVAELKLASVARIADLLEQHLAAASLAGYLTDDPQGRAVPVFLKRLGENLIGEREQIAAELRTLQQHVEHIKWIVSKQQAYAKTTGLTEPCQPAQLMDDAIGIAGNALGSLGVAVVRDYQPMPEALLQKHKELQILVNLVSNAKNALVESGRADKQMVARVGRVGAGGGGPLRIELCDNGVGIAAEHMDKLFTHGFTTRDHGHGFGLHTSALAAQEMGGSLTCTSAGLGHGAAFVLELPP